MKKSKNYKRNLGMLSKLTKEQLLEMQEIEREAIANFSGQIEELESALGMLRIGHHLGWKVLALIHNKRTLRKYEDILGINIREYFPEIGPSAERNIAYLAVQKIGNFWKAVSGEIKIDRKRELKD